MPYRRLFRGHQKLLNSHRGYDPGALVLARALARAFRAPLVFSTTSRLLVDLNRPIGHPQLYSASTRHVPAKVRARIVSQHYQPYRDKVERLIGESVALGRRVIHIASHTFTPVLNGEERHADVGLLYDPSRRAEARLCDRWKAVLTESAPDIRVTRNYPYKGTAAGLTSHLRRQFPVDLYAGIELEINQRIVLGTRRPWTRLRRVLIDSLGTACLSLPNIGDP